MSKTITKKINYPLTRTHGVAGQFIVEEILGLAGGCLRIDDHGQALVGLGTETVASGVPLRFPTCQAAIVHGLEADVAGLGAADAPVAHRIQLAGVGGGTGLVFVVRATAHVQVALLEGTALGTYRLSPGHADGHFGTRRVDALHGDELALLVGGTAHLAAVVPALAGGAAIGVHLVATLALETTIGFRTGKAGVLPADGCGWRFDSGAWQYASLGVHTPAVPVGGALYLIPLSSLGIALGHRHLTGWDAQLGALVQLDGLKVLAGSLQLGIHALGATSIGAAAS